MNHYFIKKIILFFCLISLFKINSQYKPEDTEVWNPEPNIINPGNNNQPPSDAIILFDGKDLSKWKGSSGIFKGPIIIWKVLGKNKPAEWTVKNDGSMIVNPGKGSIETLGEHGSIQLHIEWKTPEKVISSGQGRGNSGIFFQNRYEVQILDSYENRTYSNGQASSIYKQYSPLVNASRPPGQWQEYDIIFEEPKFDINGEKIKSGRLTVFHNGVLVQNNVEILGTTEFIGPPKNTVNKFPKKTLMIQDHGNLVSFRNIWYRKL